MKATAMVAPSSSAHGCQISSTATDPISPKRSCPKHWCLRWSRPLLPTRLATTTCISTTVVTGSTSQNPLTPPVGVPTRLAWPMPRAINSPDPRPKTPTTRCATLFVTPTAPRTALCPTTRTPRSGVDCACATATVKELGTTSPWASSR